jgi:AraC-like DNA-binding protein
MPRRTADSDADGTLRLWSLPDLGGILVVRNSDTRRHFPRHSHETFSVGIFETGGMRMFHAGTVHPCDARTVAVVAPDEVHDNVPADGAAWSVRGFYPPVEQVAEVAAELGGRPVQPARLRTAIGEDAMLHESIARVCDAVEAEAPALARESLLHDALAAMLTRCAGVEPVASGAREPAAVRTARDMLAETVDRHFGLGDLARAVGLDMHRLRRAFRAAYGLPPHAWHLQHRLRTARAMILAGRALAEVAQDTGFADQPHLTRQFRRIYGYTPGALQREALGAAHPDA